MESSRRYFRMRRQDIAFLRFVIEAGDGLAQLTTIDPLGGTVAVLVPPGCDADVDALLRGLRHQMPMAAVAAPADEQAPCVRPGWA